MYQWAGGARAVPQAVAAAPARNLQIAGRQHATSPPALQAPPIASPTARTQAADLFDQLFPAGVRMTAELLSDFEQWAQLTEKLVAYANAP